MKTLVLVAGLAVAWSGLGVGGFAQSAEKPAAQPWMNASLPAEQRAEMVLKQMTLDEKILLIHGEGDAAHKMTQKQLDLVGSGTAYVGLASGPSRLGLPSIIMADAAYGVRNSASNGSYSTALPSNVGSAASWDPEGACSYGMVIGKELRAQGYSMTLGGGTNLTREPRNGRTFEYMGEDPLLAGVLVGNRIKCEGEQHLVSDIKHYAVNDQESGRQEVDSRVSEKAMRESDLLAFQIGVRVGNPKAVMCSYNAVNGDYACENKYLLTDVLKNEWGFKGFVISDWGGTHSTEKASAAGLDQEQPGDVFYGEKYAAAVKAGKIPAAELDEHVRRILYAMFASGIVDDQPKKGLVDPQTGFDVARRIEEQSAVLLKNRKEVLPIEAAKVRSIAVIGGRADYGTISGGGSAQVDAPRDPNPDQWQKKVWFPGAPLDAIRAKTSASVSWSDGTDIEAAVKAAKAADVAVVFAWQWESEGMDLPNLSLPEDQDKLIAAVTAANPRTVVVLETGTAVTMPWLEKAGAVLEAWYPGSKGAEAIANVLFGDVNPSGKLPMTFPKNEADLPHPELKTPPAPVKNGVLSFQVDYNEGAKVGYKWYEAEKKPVLFPFGDGLSYTSFAYSGLSVSADGSSVSFTVTNSGKRKGAEVAEVYAAIPEAAGEPWKRLAGWQKVELAPGESKKVTVATEWLTMAVWDVATKKFVMTPGAYKVFVGGSSEDAALAGGFTK